MGGAGAMSAAKQDNLHTVARGACRRIVKAEVVIACPLVGTSKFIKFCRDRAPDLSRERLFPLERLGLFAPVFRARTLPIFVRIFSILPKEKATGSRAAGPRTRPPAAPHIRHQKVSRLTAWRRPALVGPFDEKPYNAVEETRVPLSAKAMIAKAIESLSLGTIPID
jgi:hypothetical protein